MKIIKDEIGFCEIPDVATLNIYAVGCARECVGCHHGHMKDFNHPHAKILTADRLFEKIKYGVPLIKAVVWLGGDSLYQPDALIELSGVVISAGLVNCLYTGEVFENVPQSVKSVVDVIKDGEWKGVPVTDDSSNQRFFVKKTNGSWMQVKYSNLTSEIGGIRHG
jgi:organic radical activating enzyme